MSTEQRVTAILPAYRMGAFIGRALRSIACQTHADWGIVVVDDHGPEDGTTRIVQEFATAHPKNRVELIRHAHNQGVSAARNSAMAAAKGRYLAFLDPDDIWAPWHLERTLKLIGDGSKADVATGPVVRFQDPPGRSFRTELFLPDWKVDHFPFSLAIHNFIQPSATVLKRSVIEEVGGFTTDPHLQHIEDYELWVRLVKAGKRFAFLRKPTSGYRKHPGAASADMDRMSRLHERLHERHSGFFEAGTAQMLRVAFDRMEQGVPGPWARFLKRVGSRWGAPRYPWLD
jgi:glycosyltransferase involved in cell wall biosynthesis